jgi:hypothetical protein
MSVVFTWHRANQVSVNNPDPEQVIKDLSDQIRFFERAMADRGTVFSLAVKLLVEENPGIW